VSRVIHVNTVIAHHHILHGYGHWLSNDLRGSGSEELRQEKFAHLGEVHFGRKPRHEQPTRDELKQFYREAESLLDHEPIWFRARERQVIAAAFGKVIREQRYTCWAGAVCSNHGHAMTRVHRTPGQRIWEQLAEASRDALIKAGLAPKDHPVWSARPYIVFKYTTESVENGVEYVELNPTKERLPRQRYDWVVPYDGFPNHRKRSSTR
jgi:hypothetical protein